MEFIRIYSRTLGFLAPERRRALEPGADQAGVGAPASALSR